MTRHLGSSWMLVTMAACLLLVACQPQQKAVRPQSPADQVAAQAQAFADRLDDDPVEEEVQWVTPSQPQPFAHKQVAYNRKPPSTVRIDNAALNEARPSQTAIVTEGADKPLPPEREAETTPIANDRAADDLSKPLTRDQLIEQLSAQLAKDAATDKETLRPWLARVALAAIDPRYELTNAELAMLSTADRKVVLAYQQTLTEVGRSLGDSYKSDREALRIIADQMGDRVSPTRTLTVKNATLCRKVKGFGVYEEFGRNTFLAGKTQPVIVYAELDHFKSLKRDDGVHVVKLTQEVVLYNDSDGLPVWRQKPVSIKDESRNARRDFFVVQIIQLSSRLTVGKYDMKVTITDELGEQVDETIIPIEIVADPSLTLRR